MGNYMGIRVHKKKAIRVHMENTNCHELTMNYCYLIITTL